MQSCNPDHVLRMIRSKSRLMDGRIHKATLIENFSETTIVTCFTRIHVHVQCTVVTKRIRTYCYFIRKEQTIVKRSNKSLKTVLSVSEIHVYTWYCSILTLITILEILGMLLAGFYSRQTPAILPKCP